MTDKIAGWEDFEYPLELRKEICHLYAEDIRRRLWLILLGYNANEYNTQEPTVVIGSDGKSYECILNHTSTADDAPVTGASWQTYWRLHDASGMRGSAWTVDTTYIAGWNAKNGGFRGGNAFHHYGTSPTSEAMRGPFFVSVWFEGRWGNNLDNAGPSAYNIVGATQNHDSVGYSEIWFLQSTIATHVPGESETVAGNLIPGCPLEISGVHADVAEANGYWRIKSARQINENGTDYVLVRLEDLHGDEELTLLNDWGFGGSYTKGGEAACNFGGDWYAFCPRTAIDQEIEFMMDKNMKHIAENNARCDNEMRPPDGGRYSRDSNKYWIRTVNPNRYHHYDVNAHRWVGKSNDPYYTVIESWRMLPIQTDPKEQVAPYWYKDTGRLDWRIAGNKVEIAREHLTDWSAMGPVQGSQTHLDTDPEHVETLDVNYLSVYWDAPTENYVWGEYPPMSGGLNSQHEGWKEHKFNTRCLWAWIEVAARKGEFVAQVNAAYKINWLEEHRYDTDISIAGDPAGTTYEDKWWDGNSWDLSGYRPKYNSDQKEWDYLYSKYWGENGSAVEKILSDLNRYDWWFDSTAIYVPWNIKHDYGEIKFGIKDNHDSPPQSGTTEAAEWEHPTPAGTWRKVPDVSLGYVDGPSATDPGVTGFMREKEKGAPPGVDYRTVMHGGAGISAPENFWFHSIYVASTPGSGEFGNYSGNLKDRHGPVHIHDGIAYYERVLLVLQLMRDVLNQMKYRDITPEVGITKDWGDLNIESEISVLQTATQVEFDSTWNEYILTLQNHDPTTWSTNSYGAYGDVHTSKDMWWNGSYWVGEAEGDSHGEFIFKLEGVSQTGIKEVLVRVKIEKVQGTQVYHVPAELWGFGNEIVRQENNSGRDIYMWLQSSRFGTLPSEELYAQIWLANPTEPAVFNPSNSHWSLEISCDISVQTGDIVVIGIVNYDNVADVIWTRDDTYAKLQLFDPVEDEKAPVHEPVEMYISPTVYDAKRPENDSEGSCYTWADYVAEFRIKMSSILMEDLEGNGVEYNFEGTDGVGTKKAEDFSSGYQESRKYDFVLDMDTGASPGDIDDLAQALDNKLINWKYRVTAKDNASAAGQGQTDNETQPSSYVPVVAKEGTICPPIALWEVIPHVSGDDVIMEVHDAFGPEGDRECEYLAEEEGGLGWGQGWQNSTKFTHVGGATGLPRTYVVRAETKIGKIMSLWSVPITVS